MRREERENEQKRNTKPKWWKYALCNYTLCTEVIYIARTLVVINYCYCHRYWRCDQSLIFRSRVSIVEASDLSSGKLNRKNTIVYAIDRSTEIDRRVVEIRRKEFWEFSSPLCHLFESVRSFKILLHEHQINCPILPVQFPRGSQILNKYEQILLSIVCKKLFIKYIF